MPQDLKNLGWKQFASIQFLDPPLHLFRHRSTQNSIVYNGRMNDSVMVYYRPYSSVNTWNYSRKALRNPLSSQSVRKITIYFFLRAHMRKKEFIHVSIYEYLKHPPPPHLDMPLLQRYVMIVWILTEWHKPSKNEFLIGSALQQKKLVIFHPSNVIHSFFVIKKPYWYCSTLWYIYSVTVVDI